MKNGSVHAYQLHSQPGYIYLYIFAPRKVICLDFLWLSILIKYQIVLTHESLVLQFHFYYLEDWSEVSNF